MVATVLDEDFVGVISGNHDAGDEDARYRGLERLRVVLGNSRRRVDRNAHLLQEVRAGRESRHDVYEAGVQPLTSRTVVGRVDAHRIGLDRRDAAIPPNVNAPFLYAVLKVRKHPRLDALVEGWPEVDERDVGSGAPQVQRRLGGRVPATDDDDALLERLVALAIDVAHVRQILAGHAESVW